MKAHLSGLTLGLILFLFNNFAFALLPEDPDEYANWETKMLSAVQSQEDLPSQQAIPRLGLWIRQLSYKGFPKGEKADRPVFHAAQSLLLSIPGHAKHFRDEVNQARTQYEEALKGGDESLIGETRQNLAGKLLFEISTLDHLPSVETVGVLGEFLSDERGYVKMPEHPTLDDLTTDVSGSPVFRRAATALGRLPIVNKPVPAKTQFRTPDDVLPWKQWYEQIKAGNRTFRFEGDPTEYDLDGPASKDKLARVERAMRRDAGRAGGQRKSPTGFEGGSPVAVLATPVSIAAILAGFLLVAGAVLYFLRSRKTA